MSGTHSQDRVTPGAVTETTSGTRCRATMYRDACTDAGVR